ncbi:MAG: glycosyltransferase family 4 protein [Planctomycetaceae bacterium]
MRTAHIITRLIIGGAQQNTLFNVDDQHHIHGDEVTLITGPGIGPEGSLEQRAIDRGLDLRVLPEFRRNLHPWRDWASYRAIIRELRAFKPDIVHTHSSKAGIIGRRAAAKLGIPAVHTIHGAAFHYGQNPVLHKAYRLAERIAARWCDHFISVSDAMTEQYVDAGVAPLDKFTTIFSGMDIEPFLDPPKLPRDVRQELGLSPEHVVVGKIARLFPLKGHEYIIEAAAEVLKSNENARFLFVGDGILREQYEARLTGLGIRDQFVLTGLVPPARIPELINAMDIVVHTSMWEGLARVLPQGLISGKPVVSFDIDGAKDVVISNETGFLIEPKDTRGLIDAINRLAADPELREKLGQCGRERFTNLFRHETMTEQIRDVYKRVLKQRQS